MSDTPRTDEIAFRKLPDFTDVGSYARHQATHFCDLAERSREIERDLNKLREFDMRRFR